MAGPLASVDEARRELGARIDEHLEQLVERGTFEQATRSTTPSNSLGRTGALAAFKTELRRDLDSIFNSLKKDLAELDAFTAREFYRYARVNHATADPTGRQGEGIE